MFTNVTKSMEKIFKNKMQGFFVSPNVSYFGYELCKFLIQVNNIVDSGLYSFHLVIISECGLAYPKSHKSNHSREERAQYCIFEKYHE